MKPLNNFLGDFWQERLELPISVLVAFFTLFGQSPSTAAAQEKGKSLSAINNLAAFKY
jgi:hypothetical protein